MEASTVADTVPAIATESLAGYLASSHPTSSTLFASPSSKTYLSHLSTLPLSELRDEPNTLSAESTQLTNSLTNLCHSEYATFLSLHSTSSLSASSFASFSSSLNSLLSAIPDLERAASQFTESTKGVREERKKAALVLEHHDKLLDLLDIPQLIDTCVRNGHYQEAMDLAAHTDGLAKRFPDVAIVMDVAAEVEHATRVMLAQLLSLLREPGVKLPALFRAVTFLRRTGEMAEGTLALAFLTSRVAVVQGALAALSSEKKTATIETGDAAPRYVKRYVDVWREGVYDLVTQFTTIFLERAPPSSTPDLITQHHRLISTTTRHLLSLLLTELGALLPHVARADTSFSALNSLLTQLTYCATSFGRVGMDFRPFLGTLFEGAVGEAMRERFVAAGDAFVGGFAKAAWSVPTTGGGGTEANTPPPKLDTSIPPHIPPTILTTCPPLATYTNALTTHLNALRLLAARQLLPTLIDALDASLARSTGALLKYAKEVEAELEKSKRMSIGADKGARTSLKAPATLFVTIFVPFIRRALVGGVYNEKMETRRVRGDGELAGALRELRVWLGMAEEEEGQEAEEGEEEESEEEEESAEEEEEEGDGVS